MEENNEVIKVYGDVCMRKERRKRQKLLLIDLFLDYAQNSTLHGLRYIAERGLSFIEKAFWFVTFSLSCGFCFFLINNVWVKWKTSPVIVSFSEEVVSVAKVPFPSVTICPERKLVDTRLNYSEVLSRIMVENATQEEMVMVMDVSTVCGGTDETDMSVGKLDNLTSLVTNSSLVQNLLKVAPKVNEVFSYCQWRGEYVTCEKIFKVALTSQGVCYNFNALSASEMFTDRVQRDYKILNTKVNSRGWTVTEGYTNTDENPYPRRGRENGPSADLEITLMEANTLIGSACNSMRNGFKIFVQNPGDLPQSSHYYYAALPEQVSSVAVKFTMLNTSETLRGYDPEVRQCYFPEDYKLDYFKVYTPSNCRLECQANYMRRVCGCVWFNMPHVQGTPICTIRKYDCVKTVQDELAKWELKSDLGLYDEEACRCLPACYSIQYDAEILKTSFDVNNFFKHYEALHNESIPEKNEFILDMYHTDEIWKEAFKDAITQWLEQGHGLFQAVVLRRNKIIPTFFNFRYSRVEMYFKEPRFVSMRRSELFGLTDFLANVGGLLGLFLGFSLLSLVEIVYFLTLRLCCILKRDLREEKSKVETKEDKLA